MELTIPHIEIRPWRSLDGVCPFRVRDDAGWVVRSKDDVRHRGDRFALTWKSMAQAQATYDDANLLLKLYELRREEKMREARAWFVANFKPKTVEEMLKMCPPGSENNAKMRQVITYWDMAASFVSMGVLNPEMFFVNNREFLLVWLRVRPYLAELREKYGDSAYFKNLETVGNTNIEYLNRTSPGAMDAFLARVG